MSHLPRPHPSNPWTTRLKGHDVTPRFLSWIWHIRGSLSLRPDQSSDDAFGRLAPLFRQAGTSHDRTEDRLIFRKKDQAAQDRMAVFDGGSLEISTSPEGSVLHYTLQSRALLFCFLMPLLFLVFAQITIGVGKFEAMHAKTAAGAKKPDKKAIELPQNPIDKALGAPAPEKPKAEGAGKSKEDDKKPSPTSAYVFSAIFAVLYVIGRILEDRKVKALFRQSLDDADGHQLAP